MKKFNFMGDHWKIQFLGEVQKGPGRVCKFKRRFGEKEEGGVCVCGCGEGLIPPVSFNHLHRTGTKHSHFKTTNRKAQKKVSLND